MRCRWIVRLVAAMLALAAATFVPPVSEPAHAAQFNYTVTNTSGLFETKPANAFNLMLRSDGLYDTGTWADLPFTFCYYGVGADRVWVATHGFIQFPTALASISNAPVPFPLSSTEDGICAPAWGNVRGPPTTWVSGVAPNRRFVISWDDVVHYYPSPKVVVSFQVHLYEKGGRIVFAYKGSVPGDGWSKASYACGIDGPGDSRFLCPLPNVYNLGGHPGADFQFDPYITRITGRVRYDRLLTSAAGIGGSVESGVPINGLRVEARNGTALVASSMSDASGDYSIEVCAAAPGAIATARLLVDGVSCKVRASATASPYAYVLSDTLFLDADASAGVVTFGAAQDATGVVRAPLEIAGTVTTARAWCAARTSAPLDKLDVLYDPASALATFYTVPSTGVAASMRIASSGSSNDDSWDRGVIVKEYARHVLGAVAAYPAEIEDRRLDVSSTTENAFAEAFGYYLAAAVLGTGDFIDATDASHGTAFDLETPATTLEQADDATVWVAATLYDLVDAANETRDRIDGTLGTTADRAFRVVDSATTAPTSAWFMDGWKAAGYDPVPLVRSYIAHGFIDDDAAEPNDDAGEMTSLAGVGTIRTGNVLNPHNEDWWSVVVPAASSGLYVDLVFDRTKLVSVVGLQVMGPSGALLSSESTFTSPGFGPIRCQTGAVSAGTYRIRVTHDGGAIVDDYSIQVLERLRIGVAPLPQWTEGRVYVGNVTVTGGVAPVDLAAVQGILLPPGIGVSNATRAVIGTPLKAGAYTISMRAHDSGSPFSEDVVTKAFIVNAPVSLGLGDVVAFALGRAPLTGVHGSGGTAPVVLETSAGRLPSGVSFAVGPLAFTGTPDAEESVRFSVDAVDAAGSADHADVLGVVCVPPDAKGRSLASMVAGDAGAGFHFDGVAGSTVTLGMATSRKRAKRTVVGAVLDDDGTTPLTGGKQKSAKGKFTASGVVLPESGRFYAVVLSSEGDATSFDGTVKVTPPRAGRGVSPELQSDETHVVRFGALAGAKLVLTAAPTSRNGASVRVASVIDPSGATLPTGEFVTTTKSGGVTFKFDLPVAGTWTVVLAARTETATIKYSYKLAQPKKATYSAD